MKKNYIEPQMKVVEVKAKNLICQSQLNVYWEDDSEELESWEVDNFGW